LSYGFVFAIKQWDGPEAHNRRRDGFDRARSLSRWLDNRGSGDRKASLSVQQKSSQMGAGGFFKEYRVVGRVFEISLLIPDSL
jgi:hypothetical protein